MREMFQPRRRTGLSVYAICRPGVRLVRLQPGAHLLAMPAVVVLIG